MKNVYTLSKAAFFILLVAFSLPFTTHAQTVTQSWAALASGAGPFGIAIDAAGNVYTANYSNRTVSKITSAGVVTQSWAALASTANPAVIAISATGNVYTANYGNSTVSKITGAAVLPVELLSFSGKFLLNDKGGSNLLTWQTASEVNNKGFEVERLNGNDWQTLGFVNGNNKAATYNFTDNAPLPTSYYRLRQMDNDGKETLSKVISIATVDTHGRVYLRAYPSVTTGILTLETVEGVDFQVINLLGQQVLSGKTNGQRLDVSRLSQGTYVLKVGTEVAKFVKQ
jgi:DNA-binding beta-propeller fold protein YncE